MKLNFTLINMLAILTIFSFQTKKDLPKNKESNEKSGYKLSAFEIKNGIGPIKEKLKLAPIDQKLVKDGEKIWNSKCTMCHKLDQKHFGPPLRNVLKTRTPEFVMNLILNPKEMEQKHPEIQKYFSEYKMRKINQNLKLEEARAVLEYLREMSK